MAKSIVPIVKHELWHRMFGNMTPEEIGVRITNVWISPDYECIIRRKDNATRHVQGDLDSI